jgi:hypothetical protein
MRAGQRRIVRVGGALTALALVGLALASASGAGPGAHSRANAAAIGGAAGAQGAVSVSGTGRDLTEGPVSAPGVAAAESSHTSAFASIAGGRGAARAQAVARTVDVLDGLVTAYGVRVESRARGGIETFTGRIDGLVVAGRAIGKLEAPASYDLPGVGVLEALTDGAGLRVRLSRARNGLPAGAVITVAEATASADDAPAPDSQLDGQSAPGRQDSSAKLKRRPAPHVRARLTSQRFVFPVYGPRASAADNFGAARQIGPHQGDDVFAPFGTPVLAVNDGQINRVGTLPISGNRLWLRTRGGDQFFYAHLSAFAPAAVNGNRVRAGTVLGFVGNTGDAEPTPPHLHFEVHPRGRDAVDPFGFLTAWREHRDVPPTAWLTRYGADPGRRPGSLVEVRDFIAGS